MCNCSGDDKANKPVSRADEPKNDHDQTDSRQENSNTSTAKNEDSTPCSPSPPPKSPGFRCSELAGVAIIRRRVPKREEKSPSPEVVHENEPSAEQEPEQLGEPEGDKETGNQRKESVRDEKIDELPNEQTTDPTESINPTANCHCKS